MKNKGYKVIERSDGRLRDKLPFFCPREECNRITGTVDDKYLLKYGCCSKCYVELIEGRKEPLIDLKELKKRYKKRGF